MSGTGEPATADGRRQATLPLRQDVGPSGQCHFAFDLDVPSPGRHELALELHDEAGSLSERGIPPIRSTFRADEAEGSPTPPRSWIQVALRALRGARDR